MTDTVKSWIEERREVREATTEAWEHDAIKDGGNFWTGGGRSDFHLTVDDAAFCVDAHRNFPRALDALNKVLELHVPETEYGPDYYSGKYPCVECNLSDQEGLHPTLWPCATVQAIEGAINE